MRIRIKIKNLVIASLFSAGFGVFSLLLPGNSFITLILVLLSAMLSVFIAFPKSKSRFLRIFKGTILFFFTEGAVGGILTAIYLKFQEVWLKFAKPVESQTRLCLFWILSAFLWLLFSAIARLFNTSERTFSNSNKFRVRIRLFGTEAEFSCFFDSGNLVKEPISGLPVVFLPEKAKKMFPNINNTFISGSRLIPYSTISGESCVWGMLPEKMLLLSDDKKDNGNDSAFELCAYLVFVKGIKKAEDEKTMFAILPSNVISEL